MPDHLTTEPGDQQSSAEQAISAGSEATSQFVAPVRLERVDSTNRYLADLAAAGAPEGTSVLADTQSAGRGRLGRSWVDKAGGSVLCSMLFRPLIPAERWHLCSVLVTLAARDACSEVTGVELTCKWPNDLVAGDLKVAGVLAELVPAAGSGVLPGLVVGIGINCNWPSDWPAADDPEAASLVRATSLDRLAGHPVERDAVATALLRHAAERYSVLGKGATGERALMTDYRRHLSTIGRLVRIDLGTEDFTGRALDLDDAGHLLVDVGACIRMVAAGDVVHLR